MRSFKKLTLKNTLAYYSMYNGKKFYTIRSEPNVYKTFFRLLFTIVHNKLVSFSGRPFYPSLMFASKAGAYPRLLALNTNIGLG